MNDDRQIKSLDALQRAQREVDEQATVKMREAAELLQLARDIERRIAEMRKH